MQALWTFIGVVAVVLLAGTIWGAISAFGAVVGLVSSAFGAITAGITLIGMCLFEICHMYKNRNKQ